MKTHIRAGMAATVLLLVIGVSTFGTSHVFAAQGDPPGPDRYTIISVDYTAYEWWLVQWGNSAASCQLYVDHDGLPSGAEIYNGCGEALYTEWSQTPPCPQAETDPSACLGDYLEFVQSGPATKQIGVALPEPAAWVTLDGCASVDLTNRCDSLPTLVLTGEEPLPNEKITGIAGKIDGRPFTCDPTCQVDLAPTSQDGIDVQFWALSSYGDSSVVYDAQVRVVRGEDIGSKYWYVDVISSQWRGAPQAACSEVWNAFPPVGGPPDWLSTPQRAEDLASSIPYAYLAANLISQGAVDVSACPDDGLSPDGSASTCGMDAARTAVHDWQNRFDSQIFSSALDSGIPAQLLKNLFSRESQFWPGLLSSRPEVGLGHLTDNGADTALLWNQSFYEQYCPLVLSNDACKKGYAQLKAEDQATLRGALVHSVDASCSDCPMGLDLSQADFSVTVFAQTLAANCEQTGTIVHNASGKSPGQASSYEDLWRFTLVNYNAGPGCLILALREAQRRGDPLDWAHVSAVLTPACQGAIEYVGTISQ